jgi:hypothetical protein
MSPARVAKGLAAGRVIFGAAMIAAPSTVTRGWIGADADRPGTQALTRGFGMRDVILGALTLHVVDRAGVGPRTVATCAVADVVDLGATLAAREHLPRTGVVASVAIAGGAAVAGFVAAAALARA